MLDWLDAHAGWAWALGATSSVTVFLGVVAVPMVVARMPADAFMAGADAARADPRASGAAPRLRSFARHLSGALLLVSGVAMLVLPGPGLLTIALSMMLLDVPGKRAVVRRLVQLAPVRMGLAWMRRRAGAEPFRFDREAHKGEVISRSQGASERRVV